MKIYDLKVCIEKSDGKKFWKTIGTLFASEKSSINYEDAKPCSFVIDFPQCHGIIVPRKERESTE